MKYIRAFVLSMLIVVTVISVVTISFLSRGDLSVLSSTIFPISMNFGQIICAIHMHKKKIILILFCVFTVVALVSWIPLLIYSLQV